MDTNKIAKGKNKQDNLHEYDINSQCYRTDEQAGLIFCRNSNNIKIKIKNKELNSKIVLVEKQLHIKSMITSFSRLFYRNVDWTPRFYYDQRTGNNERIYLFAEREYKWYEEYLFFVTLPIFFYNCCHKVFLLGTGNQPDPTVIVPTGKLRPQFRQQIPLCHKKTVLLFQTKYSNLIFKPTREH